MKNRQKYNVGDVIAVDKADGSYGLAVISCICKNSSVGAEYYVFDRSYANEPSSSVAEALRPEQADIILIVNRSSYNDCRYRIIGRIAEFSRSAWPFPIRKGFWSLIVQNSKTGLEEMPSNISIYDGDANVDVVLTAKEYISENEIKYIVPDYGLGLGGNYLGEFLNASKQRLGRGLFVNGEYAIELWKRVYAEIQRNRAGLNKSRRFSRSKDSDRSKKGVRRKN